MIDNLKLTYPAPGIAQLTLSQPARRNALNAAMWAGIPFLLKDVDARVLIITGESDHFASGADISEFGSLYATPEDSAEISAAIANAFHAIANFPAPTIAMIRGACVGGGAGIALACDLRFADTTARFAITPAKLGLVYPFDDILRLVSAVGISRAKDILYSARVLGSDEADRLGLYTRVVAPQDLENEVMDYAQGLTGLSAQSLRTTKAMFARIERGQTEDDDATRQMFLDGFSSDDFGEGFRAFMEKRKPDFN